MDRKLTEKTIERFRRKYGHPLFDWPDVKERVYPPRPGKQAARSKAGITPELAHLDFDAPCNVGPDGVVLASFEQCADPATWTAHVHHCDGDGSNERTVPITLCDYHLARITAAFAEMLEENGGRLKCGTKAESVFDILRAERIER